MTWRKPMPIKALRYSEYGGPEVLRLVDVETPEPGPGQVRVAVRAAGVNPRDAKLRAGRYAQEPLAAPAGLGMELAGAIDAVGPDVTTWAIGQPVFGRSATRDAVATHALSPADDLVAKPDWLTFAQAAALPIAVETAYRGLAQLGVEAGRTLLIHAAAGGVGLVATQLALLRGLTVVGTVSPANREAYAKLGGIPVDYAADGLADRIRAAAPTVDYVLDAYGHGLLGLSVELTGDPARVVTMADPTAADHGVHLSIESFPIPEVMAEVLPLIEAGRVVLPVEATFPLADAAAAYRRVETGHRQGKIVITV
ncbi:NADP-dependent oxidoreductase [Kutzneria sp. NPDC052558]|uniref:NADP-dependent oxidoreductase n=1 Tax=Kutzneria sp. NPDC052558 TaxID=3364121 RepID=UPI0037C9A8DC